MNDHEIERQWMLGISSSEMAKRRLSALLDGYRNGELSAEDICQFTSITPAELERQVAAAE